MGYGYRVSFSFLLMVLSIAPSLEGALTLGDDAPSFLLYDQEGFMHSLVEHRGKFLILFFYPRDFRFKGDPLLKVFEEIYTELKGRRVALYGVSKALEKRQAYLHETLALSYDLLADPEGVVIRAYEAKGVVMTERIAYLIGPDGRIYKKYPITSFQKLKEELVRDVKSLESFVEESMEVAEGKVPPPQKSFSFRSFLDHLVEPF